MTLSHRPYPVYLTIVTLALMTAACGDKGSDDQARPAVNEAAKSTAPAATEPAMDETDDTAAETAPEATAEVAAAEDKPAIDGAREFLVCRACHTLKQGEPHLVGPNLYGFLDRAAGTAPGFNYSAAFKNANLAWDEDTLHKWVTMPLQTVPGTTMAFAGIRDEAKAEAVIAYLREETAAE